MSSASSTERGEAGRDTGFQPWHFYLLLSLGAATWAVIVSRDTHPAALVLLSGGILAAGFVGAALHQAILAFLTPRPEDAAVSTRAREFLEQEKALVLRSIKELEFDRAMGKVSDHDFADIGGRLRARALEIMETLERGKRDGLAPAAEPRPAVRREQGVPRSAPAPSADARRLCPSCSAEVDSDAKFCKTCGERL
jgi:hypothetical protein